MRLYVLTFLATATTVVASSGDRDPAFQRCISICQQQSCVHYAPPLPLSLRLTGWTCLDDCKYGCTHTITDHAFTYGESVQQYYGKWPFWRLLGIQEPASVAFSLLNVYAHVFGAQRIKENVPDAHPMKRYYLWGALISINAWVWSAVFHTRDLPITEKLDYFSAALAIMIALYYTAVRLFHLYTPLRQGLTSTSPARGSVILKTWTYTCALVYIAHVSYLTILPRFDYSYNMAFNLTVGMLHNLLWVFYGLPAHLSFIRRFPYRPKSYRPRFAWKAGVFIGLTLLATGLELFDFPPWRRIIDAHSLWHLATVPITVFWYGFLVEDSLDDGWKVQKL